MDKKELLKQVDDKNTADCFLAALLILMKKKPYKDITIVELCSQANFSRKTFYDNFSKKEDLLNYLADDIALGFRYTDDYSGTLHYFEFWYELRDWVTVLIENDLWYKITSRSSELLIPLLRERNWNVMLGEYADMKDACFEFISAGQLRLIYLWYLDGFQRSPAEWAGFVDHILSGRLISFSL